MPTNREQLNLRPHPTTLAEFNAIHERLVKDRGPRTIATTFTEVVHAYYLSLEAEKKFPKKSGKVS